MSFLKDAPVGADSIRQIFRAWERLRIIYNLVLIPWTILLLWALGTHHEHPLAPSSLGTALLGGVLANFCFFAGPVLESYASWLGIRLRSLRGVLFVAGLVFTMFLAAVALAMATIDLAD